MVDAVDGISAVKAFLVTLSWQKLGQLCVFLLLVCLVWGIYENRQDIYGFINPVRSAYSTMISSTLHQNTIQVIDDTVKKSDIIVGIQIISIDFQRNTKRILLTNIDNYELGAIYSAFYNITGFESSLFTSDVMSNKILVDLINGEFICDLYANSNNYRLMPNSGKYVNTVCSIGIPPYYGKFSGLIRIYLNRQPNVEDIDHIRISSRNLSLLIFNVEVS